MSDIFCFATLCNLYGVSKQGLGGAAWAVDGKPERPRRLWIDQHRRVLQVAEKIDNELGLEVITCFSGKALTPLLSSGTGRMRCFWWKMIEASMFLFYSFYQILNNNWYCIPIQETREWSKLKVYYKLYSLCWSINKKLIVPTTSQKNTESNTANAVSLLPGIRHNCVSIINPMKEHGLKMKNIHER